MKRLFLASLILALVVPASAGPPAPPPIGSNTDLSVNSATIGATGSITEETNTMTFTDGDNPAGVSLATLAAGAGTDDQTAAEVANTPAGNIAAVTVQNALNELDTEKQAALNTGVDIAWIRTGLTGSAATDLDAIPIASIANGDLAIVNYQDEITRIVYIYRFDTALNSAENSPGIIRPDDFSDFGVWVRVASFNQDLTGTANVAFNTANLIGDYALTLGTSSSIAGKIQFKNATNGNIFTITSGVAGAAIGWTTPTAAPGGADYLLNVDADGTMGYTDPSTLGGTFTGGTLTSELVIDETGIEGQPTDSISDCSSFAATGGGIFYDDSEGKWKKCQDNTLSDLDTNTGSLADLDDLPGDIVDDNLIDAALVAGLAAIDTEAELEALIDIAGINDYPLTTASDLFVGGVSGAPARLAKGANNSVLGVNNAGTLGFYTNFRSDDSAAQFNDNTDATKLLQIVLDNITTGTTRTLDTGDYNSQLILATDVDASGHPLGDDTAYNEGTWNANTRVPTANAVRDQFEAEPAATRTLTNKTLDANGTGNVLKGYGYITLAAPMVFGSAVTQQTTATARVYGQALFADDVEANNYVEYILEVPRDLDTSVDLLAYFKFVLGGADTADHDYVITMIDIADSADNATAAADAVNLAYTADGSGASGDVETAGGNTLTGWAAALTPGSKWIIRITRDGDDATDDASTADSYSGPLTIRYGFTQ